jgi:hypothetical protein
MGVLEMLLGLDLSDSSRLVSFPCVYEFPWTSLATIYVLDTVRDKRKTPALLTWTLHDTSLYGKKKARKMGEENPAAKKSTLPQKVSRWAPD